MEATGQTFMLLPDTSYLADNPNVKLGRVIPHGTKCPDPMLPFSVKIDVEQQPLQEFPQWKWETTEPFKVAAGIWAGIPALGVDLKADVDRGKSKKLSITCDRVEQTVFHPTPEDLARVVSDSIISMKLKKLQCPPVYLIVGIMVAYSTVISISNDSSYSTNARAGVAVPNTPVTAGVQGEISSSKSTSFSKTYKEPIILAYKLLRIRRNPFGGHSMDVYAKFALFNEEEQRKPNESQLQLLKELQVEELTPENLFELR